ncbi:MAG: SLBB domain-containing protein [Candidatus Zixiibacteriota bacterium]|nr:MAG: SLBB domain-containing protein [candidate division Zixibacteria bacterium]
MARRIVVVLILVSVFLSSLFALEKSRGQVVPSEEVSLPLPVRPEPTQVLEKSIDPAEYLLGSGDELSIDIWGQINVHHVLTVTPEGNLLVPRVGSIQVGEMCLADAKVVIRKAILRSFRNAQITVTLLNLRRVKVMVAGAITTPGIYSVYANTRVSEVIAEAGGFLDNSSRRNIVLTRSDSSTGAVDVLRVERLGDRSRDPHVFGGDVIFVPAREQNINAVGIYGAVKESGSFEYAPHDSLLDLISLAYGLTLDVDLLRGELVRFTADNLTTTTIPIDLEDLVSGGDSQENLPLMPDDRVFIRIVPRFHKKDQVTVRGEVYYPGAYHIEEDKTTVSDIVAKAGGFTPHASLAEAEMIRSYNVVDPEFERLKNIPVADMTDSEYEYFRLRSRENPGRVACDFEKLLGKGLKEYDVALKSGDLINIPPRSMVVNVSGSVVNPGLIPYESGRDHKYYIARAGGFSWKARQSKIMIIKGQTGERMKPSKRRGIDPGDTILVPEKSERDYWKFFRDTMLVLGNIATIYLVIQQATE